MGLGVLEGLCQVINRVVRCYNDAALIAYDVSDENGQIDGCMDGVVVIMCLGII